MTTEPVSKNTSPLLNASETFEAAKSLLPYLAGDVQGERKLGFLAYRYTGFSFREALRLASPRNGRQLWDKTVRQWRREDATFRELELKASGPESTKMRRIIIELLFTRNLHLVLRKDYDVLMKANGMYMGADGHIMKPDRDESAYLNRARAFYSFDQLNAIARLMEPGEGDKPFNFSQFILQINQVNNGQRTRGQDAIEAQNAVEAQAWRPEDSNP